MRYALSLIPLLTSLWSLPVTADTTFALAQRVATTIGIGRSGACSTCHATQSEQTLRRWSQAYTRARRCLTPPALPTAQLACFSESSVGQPFQLQPSQVGFYSAGLHLPAFQQLLSSAYGAEQAGAISRSLAETTMMPLRSPHRLSVDEFADVTDWATNGMPFLSELLTPYDGPKTCETQLAPELREHILAMEDQSWQRRNADRSMLMFGCPPQSSCFSQQRNGIRLFPDVSTISEQSTWKTAAQDHMIRLSTLPTNTNYWVRSSPDGRFVAYGGSPSGIVDLQSQLLAEPQQRTIRVSAYYDPAFFPDDSAFMFQSERTGICNMSLLKNPTTQRITFNEDACTIGDNSEIPLYQSIGASLDGADYLAATGVFISDPGDGSGREDKAFRSTPGNYLSLYPLVYDGQKWVAQQAQSFSTPWELDWGLAPSNKLLMSRLEGRVGEDMQHLGYRLYGLQRSAPPPAAALYELQPYGTLCVDGLKGNFSFDDRFLVNYAYITAEQYQLLGFESADDPAFQALLNAGSANIFLTDLLTQKTVALTHMSGDQFALFPHFRSDGWIYFMVYDAKLKTRWLLSSDAAVKAKQELPTATFARSMPLSPQPGNDRR